MGKTLRNIIFSSIIAGSLLFSSCLEKVPEKISEEITEEENAYDKALNIAKNPGSIFNGNVVKEEKAIQKEAVTEKVFVEEGEIIQKVGLENYFLQGKELEEVVLIPNKYFEDDKIKRNFLSEFFNTWILPMDIYRNMDSNPYILNKQEVAKIRAESTRFTEFGIAYYISKDRKDIPFNPIEDIDLMSFKADPSILAELAIQFEDEISLWKFLNKMGKNNLLGSYYHDSDVTMFLPFVKGNHLSMMIINEDVTTNSEKAYLNSLINYQDRIDGQFYIGGIDGENIHKELGIPFDESGIYFKKALEFQRSIYDMESKDEFKDLIINQFNPPLELIEKYQNGEELSDLEIKHLSDFYRDLGKKITPTLPNLTEKLFNLWGAKIIYPVEDLIDGYM